MSSAPKVMFINKGQKSSSLSRSEGAEKSRIFSHVQQPSQGRLPYSLNGLPDPIEAVLNWDDALPHNEKRNSRTLQSRTTRRGARGKKFAVGYPSTPVPSPLEGLGIVEYDPFGSTLCPITRYTGEILDFYSSNMLGRIFPTKLLADVSRRHTLSYASKDPVALNALLCTTSGALYAHHGDEKHGYYAMYFKGQAISYLKHELAKVDNGLLGISTLYAMSLLLWVECLQGDFGAMEAHIKGLNHLMSRTEDIRNSPLPIMTTIVACAHYCSAILKTRPFLMPIVLCKDRVSLSTTDALGSNSDPAFASMASRFSTPRNAVTLGPNLLRIVSDQSKCIMFKELCRTGRISPTYDDTQYVFTTKVATDHQLLDMAFSDEGDSLTPAQNCVRLALFAFSQPVIAVAHSNSAFSRAVATQLKESLQCTGMSTLWDPSFDLLLWVLFVGAQVSYGQEEWAWLIAHIAMAVRLLGLESQDKLREVLVGFYYLSTLFDETLDKVWRDVDIVLQATDGLS